MSRDPVQSSYDRLADEYDQRWLDYTRQTLDHTETLVSPRAGERVLDLACGTGRLLDRLRARGNPLFTAGMDLSFEMLQRAAIRRHPAEPSRPYLQGNARQLPFAGESFDWVLCTNAFHFFPDRPGCLGEMNRVLAPGGSLVVVDWCADFLACRLCDLWLRVTDPAHRPPLTSRDCRSSLTSAGFDIESFETFRVGWIWGMMKVKCRKRSPLPA